MQVDIVPTLSLLLGLPIPFGNLGRLIPSFFHHHHDGTGDSTTDGTDGTDGTDDDDDDVTWAQSLNDALAVNAAQVLRYLRACVCGFFFRTCRFEQCSTEKD